MSSSHLKKNVGNIHRTILERKIIAQEKENIKIRIEERKQKKLLEQKKYIDSLKTDWRKELYPIEEEQKYTKIFEQNDKQVKVPEKLKSNWREEIQRIDENVYTQQELPSVDEDLFEVKPFIKNKIIKPEVYERWYQTSNWRDEFIEEGMSSKDFAYLYGLSIYDLQINSVLGSTETQNTQAQDIVQASADATEYAFGPEFPGSYVNTIGDPVTSELSPEEKPESLSKVDATARISPGDTDSQLKDTGYGSQDGVTLVADPWNYNPVEISANVDGTYDQYIETIIPSDGQQFNVFSINLQAGQTYTFYTLDLPNSRYTELDAEYSGSGRNYYGLGDSVLSLQNNSGDVVANNDDLFPGTYNQYVASNPGDTYPEGPGGEPQYYGGLGWTAAPISYNPTDEPGNSYPAYYVTNSKITYTPTSTGTYYLVFRSYFDISGYPDDYYGKLRIQGISPTIENTPPSSPQSSSEKTTAAYNLGGPVSAFLANPESKSKLKSKTLELSDFKSAADFEAFKAGGGNAALKQGKTLAQVIAQGKINLGGEQGGLGVLGGAATAAGALVGNFSTRDLTSRISSRLPGYSIGKFSQMGKGDHYTAPILGPDGKPAINPTTGKPYVIGGGIRGKGEWSNSMMGTLTNAINDIKRGLAPAVQTQPAKVTVTTTKTEKGTPTKTASRMQPAPSERSTIKSMPANMMGRRGGGGGGGSGSSMIQPVDPFDYPTDPLSGYTWDKKSGRYLANSYTPYVNKIKGLIRENKKMKSFKQFVDPSNYEGKPSPNGFPENPPPKMVNGYHPEYGKRSRMYNTLDKISAMSMPLTGDPETDQKIIKARQQPK